MAENSSHFKEEAEMMETKESDFEVMSLDKQTFGELLAKLCKSALSRYHPGESYEFESVQGCHRWCNRSDQYLIEFCAKNLNAGGNPLKNFKAYFSNRSLDGPEEFVVQKCVLLKDDEMVEPVDPEVIFVTEPHLKKPKLDDGVNDELETMNTLESVKQEKSTESDDKDKEEVDTMDALLSDDSEYETMVEQCTLRPQDFESGEESERLVEFCKLALAYYQKKNPEESYEFVSGHGGFMFPNTQYTLKFSAKNLGKNGNPVQNFEAAVLYVYYDEVEPKVIVQNCVLWKDDEAEPKFDMDDFQPETPLEDLEKNEYEEIVEFCKSSLGFYMKNNPEKSYEFEKIQKVKCWISALGVDHILVFHAKNVKEDTLSTFKASVYHHKQVTKVMRCDPK